MNLLNIANTKRLIHLFCRDENGEQVIINDDSFFPIYYEPDPAGKFLGYDGTPLRKVFCSEPKEISLQRSAKSYSSDIVFAKNYMINKIDKLSQCFIKYFFIDIEVLNDSGAFPDPTEALYPISCITICNSLYKNKNSLTKSTKTWWLKDFKDETTMLDNFVTYVALEKPDLLLAWNINFDYTYLYNRVPNLAKRISPIGRGRFQGKTEMFYPAGISIVDYLGLFKKVFQAEQSYKLDTVAQKHLKDGEWGDTVFGLNERVREKNINDVDRLVKLEEKYALVPYYDEIRRLSKCQWEDLYFNSRIVECLLLEEAKLKKVVLPSRHESVTKTEFQGATREAAQNGVVYDIGKFDLGSAYPSMIYNFCLDSQNIIENEEVCSCGSGQFSSSSYCNNCNKLASSDSKAYVNGKYVGQVEVNGIIYRQNEDALLPSIIKKILTIKDSLKEAKKLDSSLDIQYNAIKAIVNSCYGVMGNEYFRLYDPNIAATITYLVRDLLMYCKDVLEAKGQKIVYWDTDSLFLEGKEDISDYLNQLVQDWSKKYGKEKIDLFFGYEGFFKSLFILGKCLSGKTTIKTNKGYIPISKLYKTPDKYKVYSVNKNNYTEQVEIKKIWKTAKLNRKLYQINTHAIGQKNNRAIFTEDHPILTINGWKQVQQLISIDLICTGEPLPSKERREFILGTVLGDSSLSCSSLSFGHSIKQKQYAKYKANIIFNNSFSFKEITDSKGYQKVRYRFKGRKKQKTEASYFRYLEQKAYKNINNKKTKIITKELLENFTLISLAVLWMDDGYICKKRQHFGSIATCCFTKKEVELLSNAIKNLGIDSFIRKTENKYYRICFNSKQIKVLCEKIAPYIPTCMKYKIYKEYWSIPKYDICLHDETTELLYSSFSIKEYKDDNPVVYDIEVTKNHNFITRAGIVHNCHYYGYIDGQKEPEIKGVEIKRSSSSKYEAYFQQELLEKVINKKTKEEILEWIDNEKKRIKTLPVEQIVFPCKISTKEYKTVVTRKDGRTFNKKPPIFVRAYENTKQLNPKFHVEKGELFYYAYTNLLNTQYDVLALTKDNKDYLNWKEHINWAEMIRRNIVQKAKPVFKAMNWEADISETDNRQLTFIF